MKKFWRVNEDDDACITEWIYLMPLSCIVYLKDKLEKEKERERESFSCWFIAWIDTLRERLILPAGPLSR